MHLSARESVAALDHALASGVPARSKTVLWCVLSLLQRSGWYAYPAVPLNELPPLLVITLTKPPPERPNSAEAPLVITENSLIDSWEMESGARPSAPPTVPPTIEGQIWFNDGRGFSHARDLTDAQWQTDVSDARIFNSIMNGRNVRGNMPAFSDKLKEKEANSLVTFVRGLKAQQ